MVTKYLSQFITVLRFLIGIRLHDWFPFGHKTPTYVFLLLPLFCMNLQAQVIRDSKLELLPFTVQKTSTSVTNPHSVFEQQNGFVPANNLGLTQAQEIYWLKIDLQDFLDTLRTNSTWSLRTSSFDKSKLHYLKGSNWSEIAFGQYDSEMPSSSVMHDSGVSFEIENLIAGRYLLVEAQVFNYYSNVSNWEVGFSSVDANHIISNYYSNDDLQLLLIDYLCLGAFLLIFLFFITTFFYVKQLDFLFYSLYVLSSIICLLLPMVSFPVFTELFHSAVGNWLVIVTQVFINLFYSAFVLHYLNLRKNYPKLLKPTLAVILILILLIPLDSILFFLEYYGLHLKVLDFQRILMTTYGLFIMIALLLSAKDRLAIFVVLGSFIFMLGGILFVLTANRYFMVLGSGIEIIIFLTGLAYKMRLEYDDKIHLHQQVSIKEVSALRAQMNPHFIFNSLNSIQHLILNNDRVMALKYLSKFGKLTRNVLESSIETRSVLRKEIELLRSYLELESLRFEGAFKYEIHVDDDLDTDNVEIPLFLVQPYVENAILHGLLPNEKDEKLLTISFEREKNNIICSIEDNGVGRAAAQRTSTYSKREKKSRGMEITGKRLELFGQSELGRNSIEITDKFDSNGHPSGTKVVIRILDALKTAV